MSDLDLASLRATALAATPGPWSWRGNTDTGEPYLGGRGASVLAIGHEDRSTVGRDAEMVRDYAREAGLDPEDEVREWATDRYGEPIRESRLWFYTDHLADPARDHAIYEVAPDATTREDRRVYRADLVGIRHPDAAHIAAMDPPTTLALIARVEAAEATLARVEDFVAVLRSQGSAPMHESCAEMGDLIAEAMAGES